MAAKKEYTADIGARIRAYREQRGLSQERVAEYIEVSPQYFSRMERGIVGLSLETFARICVALDASGDELLFGRTPESRAVRLTEKCRAMPDQKFEQLIRIAEVLMDTPET